MEGRNVLGLKNKSSNVTVTILQIINVLWKFKKRQITGVHVYPILVL